MSLFGSGTLYGSGELYIGVGSPPNIPQDLRFYRTSQSDVYVFWWGFDPEFISPALATANFELQLDTTTTFTSPNLASFNNTDVITFQNGNVRKGYAVPVAARVTNTVQTWYARVKTIFPSLSDWSSTLTWTIPQSVTVQTAENLLSSLPDANVYDQEDLKLPVDQRKSLLYTFDTMYGEQFDAVYYENLLTGDDNYVTLCRDEFLYQNFGVLFSFQKPVNMQYVDYRWILMNLIQASLVGSTNEAIILTIQSFTGVSPIITDIRDAEDFFLVTIRDTPIIATAGQTTFHTSQPFIDDTFVLEQLSTVTVGSTTGFTVGPATDQTTLYSFVITAIVSSTELAIANVPYSSGHVQELNPGDTIVQGIAVTTVSSVTIGGKKTPIVDYTTDGVQGTWTMTSPQTAGTILQATFDVGNPVDPFPVIFDALVGATTLTGLVTFTNDSINVGGSGTLFLSQVMVGQEISDSNGIYLGTVASITDNTHLQLENPWAGPTEVVTAYLLQYTDTQLPPPILWDINTLKSGVFITILNPGEFVLS